MLELKKEVADKFTLKFEDLELSMGMSADFEQAVKSPLFRYSMEPRWFG